MIISQYIYDLEQAEELESTIRDSLKEYKSKGFSLAETFSRVLSSGTEDTQKQVSSSAEEQGSPDFLINDRRVRSFLDRHNIPLTSAGTKDTKTHRFYYVECINSDKHTTETKSTDTFISIDKRSGMINHFCNHSHCEGIYWKDYKTFYETRDKSTSAEQKEHKRFDIQLVSGRDLQKMNLPPIVYPVENMIPQGYTVMSAPFKYGKSWYALELCLAVAKGSPFLNQKTTKGAAVYLALEDCDRFAQERLNMVLEGKEAPEGFYYIYEKVPDLDSGFIDYLDQLHEMVPDMSVVVVDVLAIVEHQPKRGESAYKCDYRTGTALKQWADNNNIAVIAITHTTKMIHPNDVFMNTTGTNGVTGSADAIITIAKENRSDKDAVLAITGRRIREKYFKIHLKDGFIWETDGEVDPVTMQADATQKDQEQRLIEYQDSEIRKAVIKIANAGIDEELTSFEIMEKARDLGIFLLNSPKEIGGFICKYQNYFFKEDEIRVYVRKRGTASNTYKIVLWAKADEADEIPY